MLSLKKSLVTWSFFNIVVDQKHIINFVWPYIYIYIYGTHQLQLKRDTRGTRKGHACYTLVFLVIYTQLHAR